MTCITVSNPVVVPAVGNALPDDPFWLQEIRHQGSAPFSSSPSTYKVFRNVKDYGATGNGIADDTVAINSAISSGGRCGGGNCSSSTTTPAVVYFPSGTYIVSAPIIAYYYTVIIGDARKPPTIRAAPNFAGIAVIGGNQWYVNQNNFHRSVRNLVIDLTHMPASATATGLHWQVSQCTSLMNIVVEMSTQSGNMHQGIFMENGSGGFMGDMVFNGGRFGIWVGNQQFTVRNIVVNNARTAVYGMWNWGWTFQGITINNCRVGFDLATGGRSANNQTVGAEAIIDAVVTNTPIFVRCSTLSKNRLAGSLVLNNISLKNVPVAVGIVGGAIVLAGGTMIISSWGQGNIYSGGNTNSTFVQGSIHSAYKDSSLLDSSGKIFGKTHPQYIDYSADQFVSVKSHGAKGDGVSDDTEIINTIFAEYSGRYIIFFDAGVYKVTSTINIPPGSRVVGEAWSVIMGGGPYFQDQHDPHVVVQVGSKGSEGIIEITDIVFATRGPAPGAIVVEWNVHEPLGQHGACGMWDTAGTNLELAQCPKGAVNSNCFAAFLALHLTTKSTAYLEGTWVWVADHDLDGDGSSQLNIFSGRGILSESAGPVWMIGTAEHHVLYQYSLVGAKNHYMGLIQTETPYFQPKPAPPMPFVRNPQYHDPPLDPKKDMAWALWVQSSENIVIFGAGLYSFFKNYSQDRLASHSCQEHIANIDSTSSVVVYSLSTLGSIYQISMNGKGVARWGDNVNGFASTVTLWKPV
ncbi:glycoside hydrolase family 55 protein [Serpula lacrymans var. lacrymans S7.9]|uniref:Glycoside hydrolase family 55 protein n=1 Tax=Serpula lacrymans var. lacrymans (strain S7.9) TaxID=578457 RepID=F8NPS3_SERL9|nr:glycoside hydrolase family 55 protein [Serpula lacrymans var. lacrymans S7.9]EGO27229.1 glycoside hydrolase family 55 protein [Serpula lacrymans var. lacrymans S7.9]